MWGASRALAALRSVPPWLRLVPLVAALLVAAPRQAASAVLVPPGNINDDGLTNVVDVQCMILLVLAKAGGQPTPACLKVPPLDADINCDGVHNVIDVQALILLALKEPFSKALDNDGDGTVDACDPDDDNDGVLDGQDCKPKDAAIDCSESCCASHSRPSCNEPGVPDCVCSTDTYCCEVSWDALCIEQGSLFCGADCPGVCGDGACVVGETCGACPQDCGLCPTCGDGACDLSEGCLACPADCSACEGDCCAAGAPGCDDPGVTACVCAEDAFCCAIAWDEACVEAADGCGAGCAPTCGDGSCDGDESCATCAADCGGCPACGDGGCNGGESCASCSEDCGVCAGCGDGACGDGETCQGCAADCGPCTGDCCAPAEEPGCGDGAIAGCVCSLDAYCCEVAWDALCVHEGTGGCGLTCVDSCGDGSCTIGESCASCVDDCGACPATCGDGACDTDEDCIVCAADCGPCAGGCCDAHGGLGCSDPAVQDCVCGTDPWCCIGEWDALCVAVADGFCAAACVP